MRKLFFYILSFFVTIGTLFYIPVQSGDPNAIQLGYMAQEMFFRVGVIALFFISLYLKPIRHFRSLEIAIFGSYLVINSAMKGMSDFSQSALFNVLSGIIFFKIVYEHFEFKWMKTISVFFLILILANIAFAVMQYYKVDPIMVRVDDALVNSAERAAGFMKLKVHLGALGGLLMPLMWFIHPALSLICIPLLWWGRSSSVLVASVIGMSILFILNTPKKVWIPVISALIIAGAAYVIKYDMPTGQFSERIHVWHFALGQTGRGDLFFGKGLGSWKPSGIFMMQGNGTPIKWDWAHNEYVQLFYETGLIGIIGIMAYIKEELFNLKYALKDKASQILGVSFLVILMVSFFHFPFHLGRFSGLILFLMAIYKARIFEVKRGIV